MILPKILINAWDKIEISYKKGMICSERHLQAVLFQILQENNEFVKSYQLFIEPTIQIKTDNKNFKIIPDIVVTQEQNIVCAIELKYNPLGYIKFKKDLYKLSLFYKQRGIFRDVYLSTDPISGDYNYELKYSVSKNVLLVYAVIANEFSLAITNSSYIWSNQEFVNKPIKNYLQLIGSVNNIKEANFYYFDNTL